MSNFTICSTFVPLLDVTNARMALYLFIDQAARDPKFDLAAAKSFAYHIIAADAARFFSAPVADAPGVSYSQDAMKTVIAPMLRAVEPFAATIAIRVSLRNEDGSREETIFIEDGKEGVSSNRIPALQH